MKCLKCGEEITVEAKFCPKCGASLTAPAPTVAVRVHARAPAQDLLGLVSAGVILIILAFACLRNPISATTIVDYIESMSRLGRFIKPPKIFFDAAVFFLYAVGLWEIVLSGLRIVFQRSVRKSLNDLVGAFFAFYLAFILTRYATDIYSGSMTLAYFVIGIGLLVIVSAVINMAFRERRRPI